MTLTHIAGPAVNIGGRVVQRCAVCGELLGDSKNQMGPVGPNGELTQIPTWRTGGLIETTEGNPKRFTDVGHLAESGELPSSLCLARERARYQVGDVVESNSPDMPIIGVIVAVFPKLSGEFRYVVESDRGGLGIYPRHRLTVR